MTIFCGLIARISCEALGNQVIMTVLLLAAFVPVFVGTPAHADNGFSESCSMSVLLASSTLYVDTHSSASGGCLPSPQTDFLASRQNGVLFNTQAQTRSIPHKSTSFTFTLPVSSNGVGVYSFHSQVGQLRGSNFAQLAECWGSYAL